jgi:hypothetical protein
LIEHPDGIGKVKGSIPFNGSSFDKLRMTTECRIELQNVEECDATEAK